MPLLRCPGYTYIYWERAAPGSKLYVCGQLSRLRFLCGRPPHQPVADGTLADKQLRRERQAAHAVFNQLWKSGLMSKRQAYLWLQAKLDLPECEAHIAKFFRGPLSTGH